jgi:plasmid stabilization system protein ParE
LRVDLHAAALVELEDAAAWYEARGAGLGLDFAAEIERVIAAIGEHPLAFPQWTTGDPVRRAVARRFPYALFFDIEPARAVVMAIAHTSRRPGYWSARVKPPLGA